MVLTYQVTRGIPINVWDLVTMPADGTSSSMVGVPRGSGEDTGDISWYTQFDSAPSTINIEVHQSFDGTSWYYIDGGSSVSGNYKTLRGITAPFLKFILVSSSGGSKIRAGFVG